MIRSRVFVVLAIALFVADYLCAAAAPSSEVTNEQTAMERVNALQAFTAGVLKKAEKEFKDAESTKSDVESQKRKADNAEADVRTAAEAIKAVNRKKEADAVAQKATQELGNCDKLYQDAKNKAETASVSLNKFVTSAKELIQSSKIPITPAASTPGDYTNVIQSATTVTGQTTTLNQEIQQSTDLGAARAAFFDLQAGAQKVQVLKYQAESLVIVSNIETKMSEAETDIQSIQQKEKEIDTIVKEMNTKFKSAPEASKGFLRSLCTNAESFLRTTTNKVTEANKCNQGVLSRKKQLDGTLKTLMDRTDQETKAGGDARTVKWHEEFIDGEIKKIKQALRAAETSVSSAKSVKQQMQDTLDKTEQNKSTQLTDKQKQNPKDDKSDLLNKDKLRKISKDITNNPLIGGEVLTRSAANDSAVTVFIPLLAILVISAVLH